MRCLKPLVLMQLKDKLDFGFARTKKTLIRKIIFTILRFAAVLLGTWVVCTLLDLFVFDASDFPNVLTLVITFLLAASLLTSTIGLVKSLYFADDNRVLITLPAGNGWIFLSKIVVYYLYELIREAMLILPIVLGVEIFMLNRLSFWVIPWTVFSMIFVPAIPVLIGALLSIPSLFIARFINRFPVIKISLFVIGVAGFVALVVWGIGLIPEDIDLINQGAILISETRAFLLRFSKRVPPIAWLVNMFIGLRQPDMTYNLFNGKTIMVFGILVASVAALLTIVYFVEKPLFFKMMSKSFEFQKNANAKAKLNKPKGKWYAFLHKEFKLCVANAEVSMSFLAVYIAVPLLIYLMNSFYSAMNTSLKGNVMAWAFNFLIMLLPMLASNSIIATLYSKEGRAGYLKKTEPVNILQPLSAKIFFFAAMSLPSIIATTVVFSTFYSDSFQWYDCVMLTMMLLGFQYGHILYSALQDILHPQNEQYATVGESAHNPNEGKSLLLAFIISAAVALFAYLIFGDSSFDWGMRDVTASMLRLMLIALAFCGTMVVLFIRNIKAYYYER